MSTVNGSWASSGGRDPNHSGNRRYAFTVSSSASVTIDLTSAGDSFLYLLDSGGNVLASDDDSAGNRNSLITRTLSAGNYFIVAATYAAGYVGTFAVSSAQVGEFLRTWAEPYQPPVTPEEYQSWMVDPSNDAFRVTTVEIYNGTNAVYLADRPFVGGSNGNTAFDDWITESPTWETRIDDALSSGSLSAVNPADNSWFALEFAGMIIKIKRGDTRWSWAGFITAFTGVITSAKPKGDLWQFGFQSVVKMMDSPIRELALDGKNVSIGKVFNATPRLLNAATLEFEAAGNGLTSLVVRNGGADITANATINATAGTFTLNITPDRELTCDITNTAHQKVSDAVNWICTNAGIAFGGFVGVSQARKDSIIGLYITADETWLQALERIATSINCHVIYSGDGVQIVYLDTVAATDITITPDDTIDGSIEQVEVIPPASAVSIGYKPCWTVQDIGGLAGIAKPDAALYDKPELSVNIELTAGAERSPDHRSTLFYNYNDAGRELSRLYERRNVTRQVWRMDVLNIGAALLIGKKLAFTDHPGIPVASGNIISTITRDSKITTIEVMS